MMSCKAPLCPFLFPRKPEIECSALLRINRINPIESQIKSNIKKSQIEIFTIMK